MLLMHFHCFFYMILKLVFKLSLQIHIDFIYRLTVFFVAKNSHLFWSWKIHFSQSLIRSELKILCVSICWNKTFNKGHLPEMRHFWERASSPVIEGYFVTPNSWKMHQKYSLSCIKHLMQILKGTYKEIDLKGKRC